MMQSPHVQVWSFYHIFCFLSIWRAGWGVKRESNFKKYINDLHTSCFFFTYPLVRPKTTPCLSASPPLSPFSSSYLLTTEIVLCHGWLIVFVKFTCTKSWLSIFCSLNIIYKSGHHSTSASCTFLYSNVHFSLMVVFIFLLLIGCFVYTIRVSRFLSI